MPTREEIVAAARGCVGARFRPHGRDPALGLDCVGLAAIAFGRAVPARYPLRGGDRDGIARLIGGAGLAALPAAAATAAGDLLLLETGPAQFHLVVRTPRGFVHADAGLRRVTEVPGPPAWNLIGAWTEAG